MRMAQRAKEMIREEDDKSYVESFKKLLAWVDAFMQQNPGSLASLKTENGADGRPVLHSIFICHAAMVKVATTCCLRIVGIDGAHMKHKHYNHQQVILEGRDGALRNTLIATALVPIENQENYEWFLDKCTEAGLAVWLEGTERKMVVISDRDKGLAPAVANRLPSVHHHHCTRHIIGNMKDRKDIPSKFGPQECMVWDV